MKCKECDKEMTEAKVCYNSQGRMVEQPTGEIQCLNRKCPKFGLKMKDTP